jgi:transcription-repair coupling factor (superfamily II helicase)
VHTLTREARQRLQAVEELSELGAGFQIAMRDLDIRGAGTMLGAEQSGFIEDVGFETYHAILDEAVRELRRDEFADVFADQEEVPPPAETTIDIEDDVFIPAEYVANAVERLNLYRRLATLHTTDELASFRQELADRFGPPPAAVETLLTMAAMKPAAQTLRLTRAAWKNHRLFLTFPDKEGDPHFYEHIFESLLARLEASGRRWVLKDKDGRLRAIVQDVATLADAADILERLAEHDAVAAT